MQQAATGGDTRADGASVWTRKFSKFRTSSNLRGSAELAATVVPFALAWALMYWALTHGHIWLYALLILPAAGFLIRLFLIQHDCGHYSFFANRTANDWVGRLIGVLTVTPYGHWRHCHAVHHATHGDLGRRGVGDIDTLTVAEYLARSRWTRLRYRAYRHPLVMFGIGPLFVFIFQNRVPAGFMRAGWSPWVSTMGNNIGIAAACALLIPAVGLTPFLLVHVPIVLLSGATGIWLFYVQHQFEHCYWERHEAWGLHAGSLRGSSHYDLPGIMKWMTANIGVHHVHHLSSGVPSYRLPAVLREHPELKFVNRLTFLQSLKCVRLTLWDEQAGRLISFADLRRREEGSDQDRGAGSNAPDSARLNAQPTG